MNTNDYTPRPSTDEDVFSTDNDKNMSDVTSTPGHSGATDPNQKLGQAAQTVKEQASRAAEMAKKKGETLLNEQKDVAANKVEELVGALRSTGDHLQQESYPQIAQYVQNAAQRVEQFAQALRERDVNAAMDDMRSLARHQPALFIGGAVALGFLAARFLKSSSVYNEDALRPGAAEPTYNDYIEQDRVGAVSPGAYPVGM